MDDGGKNGRLEIPHNLGILDSKIPIEYGILHLWNILAQKAKLLSLLPEVSSTLSP